MALSLGVACGAPQADPRYVEFARRSFVEAPESVIGPRDQISIRIYPEAELSGTYRVSPVGTINHPLIGTVQVAGRSCFQIEEEITARLRDGLLRDPAVSCQIDELNSLQVLVIGAVGQPGPVPYTDTLTVVELVGRVGGFTEIAARDRTTVTRTVDGRQIEMVVPVQQVIRGRAPNLRLWPGDVVYVPAAGLRQ